MGVPYETFWHLNPVKLQLFIKAYQLKRKMQDEQMWYMGMYVQNAVSVSVEHCLAGEKAKSKYLEKPMMSDLESDLGLTQEEIDEIELKKMLFNEELWARQQKKKGLPETIIT